MAILKPFKAVRPKDEYASEVGALPYDVMNSEEAREMVKDKPYSFLHVDKAEVDLPQGIDIYSAEVYQKAKENLEALSANGICKQDEKPMLYIYRQIMLGREQTGIVGCTAVDDYINNVIKKHEFTRADKEADRIRHVDTLDANTGPIFLTHRENKIVSDITENWKNTHTPVYDFVSDDGVAQTVWVIDDETVIDTLVKEFAEIPFRAGLSFVYRGAEYSVKEISAEDKINKKLSSYCIGYDKINDDTVIRTRLQGDTFSPVGRGLTKPLRKLQNELKIPAEKRGTNLVVATGSTVLWAEDIGASVQGVMDKDSEYGLCIYIKRGE